MKTVALHPRYAAEADCIFQWRQAASLVKLIENAQRSDTRKIARRAHHDDGGMRLIPWAGSFVYMYHVRAVHVKVAAYLGSGRRLSRRLIPRFFSAHGKREADKAAGQADRAGASALWRSRRATLAELLECYNTEAYTRPEFSNTSKAQEKKHYATL